MRQHRRARFRAPTQHSALRTQDCRVWLVVALALLLAVSGCAPEVASSVATSTLPEPSVEAPSPGPAQEAPSPEPSREVASPEPSGGAPSPEPSRAAPSPEPSQITSASPSPTGSTLPPTAVSVPTPARAAPTPVAEPSQKLLVYVEGLLRRVSALQRAAQNEDMPELLRAQRDLLRELDRAGLVLAVDQSPLANRLRAVLPDLLKGAEGDRQRLDRASTELWRALASLGGQAPEKLPTPGPMARSLQSKMLAFQRALNGRDATALLRAQSDLLAELDRIDQAIAGDDDFGAVRLRVVAAEVRAALEGDPARVAASIDRLQTAFSSPSESRSAGAQQPVAVPTMTEAQAASLRLRRVAKDLLERLDELAAADPDGVAPATRRLQSSLVSADAALGDNSVQDAAALREALVLVHQVAQGDTTRIPAARAALEEVGTRDLLRWTRLLQDHLAQLQTAQSGTDREALARVRRRLQEVVDTARNATYYDLSPAADALRQALVPLSEVARGDDARLRVAQAALDRVGK
ncbi:MAG: hypothetical protein HY690_18955 [Chloroflexi bacterium]|nr:hypothetical protein [Chloroflexota bacterium]